LGGRNRIASRSLHRVQRTRSPLRV
jgi:hypothetical protein